MKIFLYICVNIKTVPWRFPILNPKNSRVICSGSLSILLKSRLIFNMFYCFWIFVNKLFTYLTCAYLKKKKVFSCKIFNILLSYEDKDIDRYSKLHWCTFKWKHLPRPLEVLDRFDRWTHVYGLNIYSIVRISQASVNSKMGYHFMFVQ